MVSCDPDPVEKTLEVSGLSLTFTDEASSQEVTVTSNTDWAVAFEGQSANWLQFSPDGGNGNGTIQITVSQNGEESARSAKLTVSCEGISRTITIGQDGKAPDPAKIILFENVGATPANSEVEDFDSWLRSGTGAGNVTYSGSNVQVRNTMGSSTYEGASGGNNIFFYSSPQEFVINDIDIAGETNFIFSFGISDAVSSSSYGSVSASTIKLAASLDGITYTPLEYTTPSGNSWVVVSSEFVVPEGSEALFIKLYDAHTPETVRADDFKLIVGGNGTTVIVPSPELQWGVPSSDFELGYEGIKVPVTITIPYMDGIGQTFEFSVSDKAGSVFSESRQLLFGDGDIVLSFDYTPAGMGANGFDVKADGVSIGATVHNVYGVVYYENFNKSNDYTYNPGSTQSYTVAAYTDYLKYNQPNVTYEGIKMGTTDLNMLYWIQASLSKSIAGVAQYENASGSYHVLLGGIASNFHQFVIKGLDTSTTPGNMYMTLGVYYMLGQNADLSPANVKIEYSADNGTSWTEMEFFTPKTGQYWRLVTIASEIPSVNNLIIRFTPITTNIRLDDIRIWGY